MPERLWNTNFVLLWQGQVVSQLGTQAFLIAMMFWVKHQTESATLMGLMLMANALPAVLLGLIAGTFADRYSRKIILIVADFCSGVAVLTLACLMLLWPEQTMLQLIALFITAIIVGLSGTFFRPAIHAIIPDLVPKQHLTMANGLQQSTLQGAQLVGQALGGMLYRVLGAPLLFLIDGLSYLFSALSECFIREPKKTLSNNHQSIKQESWQGLQFLLQQPGMPVFFLLVILFNFFSMPLIVLLPFYVEDYLHLTTDWYGWLIATYGLGMMLGYLLASLLKFPLLAALTLSALLMGLAGVIIQPSVALGIMLGIGLCNGYVNIQIITLLQQNTAEAMRGRVFGILTMVSGGVTPLAMALSGWVFDLLSQNITVLYASCAIILICIMLVLNFNHHLRQFLAGKI